MYVHWRTRGDILTAELTRSERVNGKEHRVTLCNLGSIRAEYVERTPELGKWECVAGPVSYSNAYARVQFWVRALGVIVTNNSGRIETPLPSARLVADLEARVPFPSAEEATLFRNMRRYRKRDIGGYHYLHLSERYEERGFRERDGWEALNQRLASETAPVLP